MTKQQEKILAVLDMSEVEQKSWCWVNIENEQYYTSRKRDINLADLAFRLRDEAVKSNHADFHEAIYDVMMKVEGCEKWATAFWGECIAKPIHWIIAAEMIKAKESKNDNG